MRALQQQKEELISIGSISYHREMVEVDQIRAARGLLGWSQTKLAEAAHIPLSAVKSLEGGKDVRLSTFKAVEHALTAAGVLFLDPGENRDGGRGIRLRQ